jgi:hypothetical protein
MRMRVSFQFTGRTRGRAIAKARRRPPWPRQNFEVGMSDRQVAIYARVSTEQQARDNTIASQNAALRERIAADGGVSRMWGDGDVGDMTGRSVAGWGFADGVGLALG